MKLDLFIQAAAVEVAKQPNLIVVLTESLGPFVTPALLLAVIGWVWRLTVKIALMDRDIQELKKADIASRLASIETTQSLILAQLAELRQDLRR